MQVSIRAAKMQFSELIEAALAGEDVFITRGDKPVAFNPRPYRLGGLEGQVPPPPEGFFGPLDDAELRDWQ